MLLSRKLGPRSRALSAYFVPISCIGLVAAGAELGEFWSEDVAKRLCLALLVVALPGALLFGVVYLRDDLTEVAKWWIPVTTLAYAVAVALAAVCLVSLVRDVDEKQFVFFTAFYLLVVAVLVLSRLEAMLRSVHEHIRWRIKYLVVGIGAMLATIVYLSSKMLVVTSSIEEVQMTVFRTIALVHIGTVVFVFQSWLRSDIRRRIKVSQTLAYGSVTLFVAGVYLTMMGVVTHWSRGRLLFGDIEAETLVFVGTIVLLCIALLSRTFRQRVRSFVRRNMFAGRYDYRLAWIDAATRIHANDAPANMAQNLADIIQSATGVTTVTVWLKDKGQEDLSLSVSRGAPEAGDGVSTADVYAELSTRSEPLGLSEARRLENTTLEEFLEYCRSVLLVPLVSAETIIGVITIGSERGRREYGWEAQEFFKVVAGHAAGELYTSELLAGQVEAKEAEAFKTFSTFLLHDLKNFASTLALVGKNASKYGDDPEFLHDAFHSVVNTADKIKNLCNSLRFFSSGLASDQSLEDLNEIVRSVAESIKIGVGPELRLDLESVPRVSLNAAEIERVIHNLVLNSREATPEGGLITVSTRRAEDAVELEVRDSGCGIEPEFLRVQLFVPFQTTKSDGLGIGLFQTKKIVDAHSGSVEVDSAIGEGTTVRIRLPLPGDDGVSTGSSKKRSG